MYGFEKSERANIGQKEKKMLQEPGKYYLSLTDKELESRIKSRALREIKKGAIR